MGGRGGEGREEEGRRGGEESAWRGEREGRGIEKERQRKVTLIHIAIFTVLIFKNSGSIAPIRGNAI